MALAQCDLVAFVSTANPARALEFYGRVLGLRLVSETPVASVFDAHGTMLRVTTVAHLDPAPHTILGWAVRDIDQAIDDLAARGVVFLRFDGLDQDSRGTWRAPSGARVAWLTDPDGNTLSLTQF
jgi:catechol 2,3-dioxygenase-like lactoylglutathione lyase family enzyme